MPTCEHSCRFVFIRGSWSVIVQSSTLLAIHGTWNSAIPAGMMKWKLNDYLGPVAFICVYSRSFAD